MAGEGRDRPQRCCCSALKLGRWLAGVWPAAPAPPLTESAAGIWRGREGGEHPSSKHAVQPGRDFCGKPQLVPLISAPADLGSPRSSAPLVTAGCQAAAGSCTQTPMALDAHTVAVPFDSLKRVTRERKYVVEEVEGVLRGVRPDTLASGSGEGGSTPAAATAARLEQFVQQLQGLKRKLEATSLSEREDLGRCRARLQHLRELGAPSKDAQVEWNRRRIDGLLVDHMLRGGYNQAAAALATSSGIEVGAGMGGCSLGSCTPGHSCPSRASCMPLQHCIPFAAHLVNQRC